MTTTPPELAEASKALDRIYAACSEEGIGNEADFHAIAAALAERDAYRMASKDNIDWFNALKVDYGTVVVERDAGRADLLLAAVAVAAIGQERDALRKALDCLKTDFDTASGENETLRMELSLRRPSDKDVAATHAARKQYRAKLKELYGNADALPMEIRRLTAENEALRRAAAMGERG